MRWLPRAALAAAIISVVPLPAQNLRAPFEVSSYFAPAGWMGDGSRGSIMLRIDENYTGKPRPGDTDGKCMRISWEPRTSSWAGLYWQVPAGNWGAVPGVTVTGASRVVFWASGELGSEIVEFKAGGLRATGQPYKDSFEASLGAVRLTTGWRQYAISLAGKRLDSVIGAFTWTVRRAANLGTVTFYLDDIRYE